MMRAETTLPPGHALISLWAATDGLTPDQRHRFMDCLAGCLSVVATPEQWDAALELAAERVREEGAGGRLPSWCTCPDDCDCDGSLACDAPAGDTTTRCDLPEGHGGWHQGGPQMNHRWAPERRQA